MTKISQHNNEPFKQLRDGFIANLVVAASVGAYGSVLGLLAAQKDLTWFQLLIMNLSVFAGSAQFVMIDMWIPPLPILEITLAVCIINMRYTLIGASLSPLFQETSLIHKLTFMHLVADENWAITMARYHHAKITTWFLLGGGICVQLAWCGGTLLGHRLGAVINNPEQFGLDFSFVAVFTALVLSFWKGRRDILPWLVAAAAAIASEALLPGKWYIICGGISGALTAAALPEASKEQARD